MNKRAAVMAADSAVTVTKDGNTKIYNTETKIFQVSNHPVGVMLYNKVEFLSTPWDLILKLFRQKCGNKEHASIQEYAESLVAFLHDNDFFCNKEVESSYLSSEFVEYFYRVMNLAQHYASQEGAGEGEDLNTEQIHRAILRIAQVNKEYGNCAEWEHLAYGKFQNATKEIFDGLDDFLKGRNLPTDMNEAWIKGFYEYIRSADLEDYTGLVFVGYGSKDIFPSLVEIQFAGAFDGRLRYWMGETEQIDFNNAATICPFGQKDVIHSLLKGMRPDLQEFVLDSLEDTLNEFKDSLISQLDKENAPAKHIGTVAGFKIEDLFNRYAENLREKIQESSVSGVVDAVECFNIADMAKMAESLISVTNLHRHFSSSEESVGGPVDVAVITKTEGFVWIKHKTSVSEYAQQPTR